MFMISAMKNLWKKTCYFLDQTPSYTQFDFALLVPLDFQDVLRKIP